MSKNKAKHQIRPPARQSEKSDKKSGAVKLLVISALVLLGVAIFFLMKEKRSVPVIQTATYVQQTPNGAPMVRGLVPAPIDVVHRFSFIDSMPEISLQQLRDSADVILKLEGNPFLFTADDKEIFALLKEYVGGQRIIQWARTFDESDGRMSYGCNDQAFQVLYSQGSTEFVALTFYHELKHASDCFKYMREHGITDPVKMKIFTGDELKSFEEVAYAAQVRFFLALWSKKMLPTQVSRATEINDAGIFQQTMEAWHAIHDNKFGEWFDQMTTAGPRGNKGSSFIKKVEPAEK